MALRQGQGVGESQPADSAIWTLWGRGSVEVAGESYYSQAISSLFGHDVGLSGAELAVEAHLIPEPSNRYDRNAVKVMIGSQHVGYLAAEDAARYQPRLAALIAIGTRPAVAARVWARPEVEYDYNRRGDLVERRTGRLHARITLALDQPHRIVPLTPQPEGVQLIEGRAIKVKPGEGSGASAEPWLCPEGEAWVHATLHSSVDGSTRSPRDVVAVRLNGIEFGTLTPAMSAHLLPLLTLLEERASVGVARALLRGNRVQSELSLHVARTSEIPEDWLACHVYAMPIVRVPSPPNGSSSNPDPGVLRDVEPSSSASDEVARTAAARDAGWYEDPDGVAPFRYWDGATWTSRIKMSRP